MNLPRRSIHPLFALACLLAGALPACTSSSSGSGGTADGSEATFILNSVHWGRLVDVFDVNGVLIKTNQVIEPDITNDAVHTLGNNSLTDQFTMTLAFAQGSADFDSAYAALDDALPVLTTKGDTGFGADDPAPPFPVVPRNGAIKLSFNNGVDSDTVDGNTVQILQGFPPDTPFSARYIVDADDPRILIVDATTSQFEADNEGGTANLSGFPRGVSELVSNLRVAIPSEDALFAGVGNVLKDVNGLALSAQTSDPVDEDSNIIRLFRSGLATDDEGEYLEDGTAAKVLGIRQVTISVAVTTGGKRRLTYTFPTLGTQDCSFTPTVGDMFAQGTGFGIISAAADIIDGTGPEYVVDVTLLNSTIDAGSATARHIYNDTAEDATRKPCFVTYSVDPIYISDDFDFVGVDPDTDFTFNFTKPLNPGTVLANDTLVLGYSDDAGGEDPRNLPNISTANYYGLDTGPPNPSTASAQASTVTVQIVPSFDQKSFTVNPYRPLRNDNSSTTTQNSRTYTDDKFYLHLMLGSYGPTTIGGQELPLAPEDTNFGTLGEQFEISVIQPLSASETGDTAVSSSGISLRFNTTNLVEDGSTAADNRVVGGQYGTDTLGRIAGRPVQHFSRVADKSVSPNQRQSIEAMVNTSTTSGAGTTPVTPVKAPLLPLGCRMMTLYRYFDMGLTMGDRDFDGCIDDLSEFNIDVEGMNWSPDNQVVLADNFSQVKIRLSHSRFAPDEVRSWETCSNCMACGGTINCTNITGCFESSGLLGGSTATTFDENPFELVADPGGPLDQSKFGPRTVFTGQYTINPSNAFDVPGHDFKMFPWPEFQQSFTWRDTTLVDDSFGSPFIGGPNTNGVDPDVLCEVGLFRDSTGTQVAACLNQCTNTTGNCNGCQDVTPGNWNNGAGGTGGQGVTDASKIIDLGWPASPPTAASIPSLGLPLLADFLVTPDGSARALNIFRTFQANPNQTRFQAPGFFPRRPFFRLISGGGTYQDGRQITINPDSEVTPAGEVDPATLNFVSEQGDDVFYAGQIDLVTKTSVVYTRWFDTASSNPTFNGVVIEPTAEELSALGVSVELAYRAAAATPSSDAVDGDKLDPYGNVWSSCFSSNQYSVASGWKNSITDLNSVAGVTAVQVRIIFRGNATANLAPWLEGLHISFDAP